MLARAAATVLAAALLSTGAAEAGLPPEVTLHRPSISWFFMDYDGGDSVPDRTVAYGLPGDVGLLADVDGDTLADLIVYRGGNWFIDLRNDGTADIIRNLGGPDDLPVAADFNGKGRAGIGIYRPSNGTWYLDINGDGAIDHISVYGGAPGDQPVVADYNGDGRADRAIFNAGVWSIDYNLNGTTDAVHYLGLAGDLPVAGDFDGDWLADNAVFRGGVWFLDYGNNSSVDRTFNYGGPGDLPLFGPVNPAASLFVRAGAVGGTGTQAQPFGTVNQALAVATPGNILRIGAGNYPENIIVFRRQGLTFLGAGVQGTFFRGGSASGGNPQDAMTVFESDDIVLRNLHVKSPDRRGVINQGSALTLDRVSTKKNFSHNALGVGTALRTATLLIDSSDINRSRMGNGLRLEGGVVATVRRSSIDKNGLEVTDPRPTINGRGVESFLDSQLTLEHSSVSQNYDGGLLIVQTSSAIIRNSTISLNGINGIFFLGSPSAEIHGNFILGNGTKGARGAATGYNGIEVADGWTGPQMLIHENSIFDSTAGGIYIGGSAVNVNVADNHFYNNFLGVTIANPANVTLQGNLFELPAVQGAEEGILIVGPGPVVTVGGAGPNTFTNYLNAGGASPAIHCGGSVTVSCPAGGNVWQNVDLRVLDCPATCSSAP
jgi:nitrous oxidase accessory protein NosD